jgi:hypothetical protein
VVVAFHVEEAGLERLRRAARDLGLSADEAATLLAEERLRQREFPGLEFRDTPVGRHAFLGGTRLGVWQVAEVAIAYEGAADAVAAAAEHLAVAPAMITLALAYERAYPDEVAVAAADLRALNERLLAVGERK